MFKHSYDLPSVLIEAAIMLFCTSAYFSELLDALIKLQDSVRVVGSEMASASLEVASHAKIQGLGSAVTQSNSNVLQSTICVFLNLVEISVEALQHVLFSV